MDPQKPKNTALPKGSTAAIQPFGTVEFTRPTAFYLNKTRDGNAYRSVNAFTARLPIFTAFGPLSVTLTCYMSRQANGDFQPEFYWPSKQIVASDTLKARALSHVNGEAAKWPSYQTAVDAAFIELKAAEAGKTVKKAGLPVFSPSASALAVLKGTSEPEPSAEAETPAETPAEAEAADKA